MGTRWAFANSALLLRVPSVIVEHEFNVLINPLHPDMKGVIISNVEEYHFDRRLLR